jgi:hypothetical protein
MTTTKISHRKVDDAGRQIMLQQIGRMNVLAICGGRVFAIDGGIDMPCGAGYRVRVFHNWADEYTVQRVFVRGGKEFDKGTKDAWAGNVGEVAYYASCFRMDDGNWTYMG